MLHPPPVPPTVCTAGYILRVCPEHIVSPGDFGLDSLRVPRSFPIQNNACTLEDDPMELDNPWLVEEDSLPWDHCQGVSFRECSWIEAKLALRSLASCHSKEIDKYELLHEQT